MPPWGASSRPETAPPSAIRGPLQAPDVLPVYPVPVDPRAAATPTLLIATAAATRPIAQSETGRSPERRGRPTDRGIRSAPTPEVLRRWRLMAVAERRARVGRRRAMTRCTSTDALSNTVS